MVDILTIVQTLGNWVVIILILYVALRIYAKVEKTIIKEVVEEAIQKLREEIITINALRNLRQP
jgi:hypothetical protein